MATNKEQYEAVDVSLLIGIDAVAHRSVLLWEKLSLELTEIIGENGFHALYLRCVHRARVAHPWLPAGEAADFADLKESLEQQVQPQALEVSTALLNTFLNTLTLLIGGALTAAIVQAAWAAEITAIQKGHQ